MARAARCCYDEVQMLVMPCFPHLYFIRGYYSWGRHSEYHYSAHGSSKLARNIHTRLLPGGETLALKENPIFMLPYTGRVTAQVQIMLRHILPKYAGMLITASDGTMMMNLQVMSFLGLWNTAGFPWLSEGSDERRTEV